MEGDSLNYDVKWERSDSFHDVMGKYRLHLENSHPCMKCHNIFDGYFSSTIDLRYRKRNFDVGTPYHFDETKILQMDRSELWSNTKKNKKFSSNCLDAVYKELATTYIVLIYTSTLKM